MQIKKKQKKKKKRKERDIFAWSVYSNPELVFALSTTVSSKYNNVLKYVQIWL